MTIESLSRPRDDARSPPPRAITIAVMAMGGEGGGVLADWIVDLGEHAGFIAQATSVPGVAQRTGATIYYIELFPEAAARAAGRHPVLALMPTPGEVDVVIASELMEAGRAIQRGLVTPDRTALVASTHRVYSMTEKTAMGDGRVDSQKLLDAGRASSSRFVSADFAKLAEQTGSVISAALFGGLAAVRALPFERQQFEDAIRRGGIGVKASMAAFAAGHDAASAGPSRDALRDGLRASSVAAPDGAPTATVTDAAATGPGATPGVVGPALGPRLRALDERIAAEFPAAAGAVLRTGVLRLADWQDERHAADYLDRLAPIARLDATHGDAIRDEPAHALLVETARHLALWMSYEDTVRVADLKTRRSRFDRVGQEVRLRDDQLLAFSEYLHPRVDEIADTLPAPVGRWLLRTGWARGLLGRFTRSGRTVRTSSLGGFLLLYSITGMRRMRRSSLRFGVEMRRIEAWLARIAVTATADARLALEVARCQRLVKGYGDTHARGWRNFERLMQAVDGLNDPVGASPEPAATLRSLRDAALADDTGAALDGALARVGSLRKTAPLPEPVA
jgi:indolepyruvate ferredoxin oxidoreductase, beta subunit